MRAAAAGRPPRQVRTRDEAGRAIERPAALSGAVARRRGPDRRRSVRARRFREQRRLPPHGDHPLEHAARALGHGACDGRVRRRDDAACRLALDARGAVRDSAEVGLRGEKERCADASLACPSSSSITKSHTRLSSSSYLDGQEGAVERHRGAALRRRVSHSAAERCDLRWAVCGRGRDGALASDGEDPGEGRAGADRRVAPDLSREGGEGGGGRAEAPASSPSSSSPPRRQAGTRAAHLGVRDDEGAAGRHDAGAVGAVRREVDGRARGAEVVACSSSRGRAVTGEGRWRDLRAADVEDPSPISPPHTHTHRR